MVHACCYRKACKGALFSFDAEEMTDTLHFCKLPAALPNLLIVHGESYLKK